MSLVWHIARKDLFRLRVILLLWAAVLTARMAFALIQSHADTGAAVGCIVPAWIFGSLFLPLLGVGLVMGALADEAVCDSDAYWITRPISGGQLLAAKLAVLGLLSLVPAVLIAPWWLAQGYDAGLLATAFLHTLKWQLIVMILAAPVAALSGSNSRFATNALLTGVAGVALLLIHNGFATDKVPADFAASYAMCLGLVFALWVAATAAIRLNQFRTRHTRRSLAIAVAAILLAFGLAAFTGSRLTAGPALPPPGLAAQTPQVLATVDPKIGAGSFRDGRGIRVTGIIPNDPRGMIITVSESMPDFSDPRWTTATVPSASPSQHEAYFLVHRHDGRSLRGTVAPVGEKLSAATLAYFRDDVTFSPPSEWRLDPAFDFQTWVSGADLVKVGADDELEEFPRALAPAATPLRP